MNRRIYICIRDLIVHGYINDISDEIMQSGKKEEDIIDFVIKFSQ